MQNILKTTSAVLACLIVIHTPTLLGNELNQSGLFASEQILKNFEFKMPFKMGLFNLKKQIRVMTSFNNFMISFNHHMPSSTLVTKLSGFTEFSVPAGTSVYAIRGGNVESVKDGIITIVEKSIGGTRKWIYSNLEPSSIPDRILRMVGSSYPVYSNVKIGAIKGWDGINRAYLKSDNSSNLRTAIQSFDHLRLEVRYLDKNGKYMLFDPLPYFGLKDNITPVIKDIYFLRGKNNQLYDNFFSKPVVRGEVKIAINAYDKMNIPETSRNEIVRTDPDPKFKLGIKQASLRIEKVQTGEIIYRSLVRPVNGLNINNRLSTAEKFYLKSINSDKGIIFAKSGKLNRLSFLVLTTDPQREAMGEWNTLEVPNGVYKIIITVSDGFGNKTIRSSEVLVNN